MQEIVQRVAYQCTDMGMVAKLHSVQISSLNKATRDKTNGGNPSCQKEANYTYMHPITYDSLSMLNSKYSHNHSLNEDEL